jgi:alkaline phosphatase D
LRIGLVARLYVVIAAAACLASAAPGVAHTGTSTPVLAQTPLVGGVTDTSAVVVVRSTKPATVVVHYGVGLLDSATSPVTTLSGDDDAGHFTLDGLLPETTYSYSVEINGVLDANVFSFRTFPPATEQRSFTFLAYADQDTTPSSPAPAWAAGAAENPAFVVQLGDFTHTSGATKNKRKINDFWRINRIATTSTPAGLDFSAAIAGSFPLVHIWDDHDYGLNNGDRKFKYRSLAMRAFGDDFPTYPLGSSQGFWQSFRYAQAEVFVLDLRSQRDPDGKTDDATKTMLGATQKAWLLNGLLTSTATWKFIVSSSVWNPHSKPVDSWAQYQHEQDEIVDFIRTNAITGVIFMSGDIHSSGAIDNGTNSYFPEISVPHTNLDETACTGGGICGTWSEGFTAGHTDGGYAKFIVTPDSVTLEAKGTSGVVRHTLTVTAP